jgi:glutamyl-tRNA synthetase
LHLAGLLGLPTPRHAHVPLVLGPDGARLAKRHGAVTLAERRESPRAIVGWLAASLGMAQAGEELEPRDLLDRFDPDALPTHPSVFGER